MGPDLLAPLAIAFFASRGQSSPIDLFVDATNAPRNLIHTRELIPVVSGPLNLYYPKWIPGEHAPSGPLNEVVNLHFRANGKEIEWRRDDVEMFEFHLDVPAGATVLEASFDEAAQPGASCTANLARISWHRNLLYPAGYPSDDLNFRAHLVLPEGMEIRLRAPDRLGQ